MSDGLEISKLISSKSLSVPHGRIAMDCLNLGYPKSTGGWWWVNHHFPPLKTLFLRGYGIPNVQPSHDKPTYIHTSTKATIADAFVVLHQHPLLRTQEMHSDRLAERLSDPCALSFCRLETPTASITVRFARFYVTDATDATDATRRPATCLAWNWRIVYAASGRSRHRRSGDDSPAP